MRVTDYFQLYGPAAAGVAIYFALVGLALA